MILSSPRSSNQIGLMAPILCALLSFTLASVALKQATRYQSIQAQAWLSEQLLTRSIQSPRDLNLSLEQVSLQLRILTQQGDASLSSYLKTLHVDQAQNETQLMSTKLTKAWFDAYWSPRNQWEQNHQTWIKRALTQTEIQALGYQADQQAILIAQIEPQHQFSLPWTSLFSSILSALLGVFFLRKWAYEKTFGGVCIALWGSLCVTWPLLGELANLQTLSQQWAQHLGSALPNLLPAALLVPLTGALPWILLSIAHLFTKGKASPHRIAYTYMAPTLISVGLLVFIPFILGVALAFTQHHHGRFDWVGLAHFYHILGGGLYELSHPLNFYFTLGVTILWTVLNVLLHTSLGLGLALLLNREGLALRGIYRALLIIPWAIPNYITALIWKGMFHQQYGLINHTLDMLGIAPVPWMSSFWGSMTANVTTNTWLGFPFMMVVCLGALQSVPRDLYEAADLAGANAWIKFRHITFPLLIPALTPAIILGSVWTFNMFNIIYLVSGGQPNGATDILITEAYRWAFEQDRYGYAAAYSLVIFVILILYAKLTQRLSKAAEEVYA